MMEIREIQRKIKEMEMTNGWVNSPDARMTFLVEEAGELAKEVRKDRYGELVSEDLLNMGHECADVIHHTLMLADDLGVDIQQAISQKYPDFGTEDRMDMGTIQEGTQSLRDAKGWGDNPDMRMTFLAEELGEVAKEVRLIRYGEDKEDHLKALGSECADIFYNLAALANHFKIDLEQALIGKKYL